MQISHVSSPWNSIYKSGVSGVADDWSVHATRKGNNLGGAHYANRTHCKNGHEFTPENTRLRKDSGRVCRQCKKDRESKGKPRQSGCKAHGIKPWIKCEECSRAYKDRQNEKRREKRAALKLLSEMKVPTRAANRLIVEASMYNGGFADLDEGLAIKKNALDNFKLTAFQAQKQEPLNFFVDGQVDEKPKRPKCEDDPEAYFFEPDSVVTDEYARMACEGCPLMGTGLCLDYVKATASDFQISIAEGRVLEGKTVRERGKKHD